MKVLCLATEFPPARGYGLGRYAAEHAAALARHGFEVHVATCNWDGGADGYERSGVQVSNAPCLVPFEAPSWIGDVLQSNVHLLARGVDLSMRHSGYDIIQVHDWLAAGAAKALRTLYGARLAVCMHDTSMGRNQGHMDETQRYVAEMERWLCELADGLMANSEFMRRELSEAYGVPPDRVEVIYAGVDPAAFATDADVPAFRSLFCAPQESLVAFVGRLAGSKGPQVLLDAIPTVLAVLPATRIVFAGDGPDRAALEQRAADLGVGDHVRFVGHLSGKVLATFYHAADLVVIPSLYEPFGMVALEAMVCRRPVIASDTGGLRETVQHGVTGMLVPPRDPRALASAVAQILLNEQAANELGQRGHDVATTLFGWDDVARRTADVYRRLLSSR